MIKNDLDNYSQCERYICKELKERIVMYEEVKNQNDAEIPEGDYLCFIQPYENKKRLDRIMAAE